jgi:PilZ domain
LPARKHDSPEKSSERYFVDFQLRDEASQFLESVRFSPSNRTAVIFAISDSDTTTAVAFSSGSNFVVRRPLSSTSIGHSLKAAYGLIVRELRRYFRCPVEVPAVISRLGMRDVQGFIMNISEGGISVISQLHLHPGDEVELQFGLPGHESCFVTQAIVCWCKEGFLGMQFSNLADEPKRRLQEWLSHKLEAGLPRSIARRFKKLET